MDIGGNLFENLTGVRLVVDIKTLYVSILAVGSMVICKEYSIEGNFPLTLISTAIIFPIVFSIGGAYKRRENALSHYGSIKANGRAIFHAVRDWMPEADEDSLNQTLLERINEDQDVMLTGTVVKERFYLRMCILHLRTDQSRLDRALSLIDSALQMSRQG